MSVDSRTLAAYRAMRERDLQECVRRAALAYGFLFYHTHDSRRSPAGFPDCVMLKGKRHIYAELKREGGKLSDAQWKWFEALSGVPGVEVYVWRPSAWFSGEIEAVFRGEQVAR